MTSANNNEQTIALAQQCVSLLPIKGEPITSHNTDQFVWVICRVS